MNNYERVEFIERNKLRYFPIEKVIKKIFDKSVLISNLAKEELIRRHPVELPIDEAILILIVRKMSIEQIYELVLLDIDTPLCKAAYKQLEAIFDYYEKNNPEYYRKIMADSENEDYSNARRALRLIKGGRESKIS